MEGEPTPLIIAWTVTDTLNSGSQTMAFVMALQQGWSPTMLKFQGSISNRRFFLLLSPICQ